LDEEMRTIEGIPVSPGIAVGKVTVWKNDLILPPLRRIPASRVEKEIEKFSGALQRAEKKILETRDSVTSTVGKKYGEIFSVHLLLLKDHRLHESTVKYIRKERMNAKYAFHLSLQNVLNLFGRPGEELFEERKRDILDVADRVFSYLANSGEKTSYDYEVIIAAHDLSPSQTANLDPRRIIGIATEIGSETSHTAIMAKALEIPAVVGCGELTELLKEEQTVVLDGFGGKVIMDPTPSVIKKSKARQTEFLKKKKSFFLMKRVASQTKDGVSISLLANIALPEEANTALKYGAQGVGLYRTEYLFMNREDVPGEEEQYHSYQKVVQAMKKKPVIIRTLDIGGDKFVSHFEKPRELNPLMGLRAVRFCLGNPEIFRTQIRAILRAGAAGNMKILLPMISTLDEVWRTKEIISGVVKDLSKKKKSFSELPVGIMIEVPSAALLAESFAKETDFFSIGTNDLIQYTMAVDRVNEKISYLYQPFHPAILLLLKNTVEQALQAGIEVSICGESASIPEMVLFLVGLGLTRFSMTSSMIPEVKQIVRSIFFEKARAAAQEAITFPTHGTAFRFLHNVLKGKHANT
jgi:phosphotransferase system enzyme I (PtsI)